MSLDAREQSLLYGELEYHMSDVLNGYVTAQLERGRVSTDKLKRVDDAWRTQGRLPVVGFRYDLATQIDLVTMHMDDFEFPGAAWTGGDRRRQHSDCSDQQPCDPIDVLRAVGIDARAMSVRTFCMPDSLVARHIVHAQELFDLVGAEKAKHDALGEIVSFFRLCLDNARAREATKLDEAEQQRRSRARGDPRRPY